MKLESLLLGMFIVGALVMGGYGFISSMATQYDIPVTQDISVYNESLEQAEGVRDSYQKLTNSTLSPTSFLGGLGLVWETTAFVVKTPFNIGSEIIASISTALPIPSWAVGFITALFVVLVMFALISLILRYKA